MKNILVETAYDRIESSEKFFDKKSSLKKIARNFTLTRKSSQTKLHYLISVNNKVKEIFIRFAYLLGFEKRRDIKGIIISKNFSLFMK